MPITRFALRNPLVVTALTVVLLCFGAYAFLSMGIGIIPNVSFPQVVVTTTDAGADPATIESQVTKPVEDAVAGLANVDSITSTSSDGLSSVNVQFTTAADPKLVAVDVERVLNAARNTLPAGADPPTITRFDSSAIPAIVVGLSGPQSPAQLQQVATDTVQRAFEAAPGVQSVAVSGGQQREIRVTVDPARLRAYGLGINTVQQALQNADVQIPAGAVTANGQDVNVRLDAAIQSPSQLGQIVVATPAAGPVYLRDVATVDDSVKTVQTLARVNGAPAVALVVDKAPDGNTIAVSKAVRQVMDQLQPTLPAGMRLTPIYDAAAYTQQSFDTIRKTLAEAILCTGLILLLFLHTWRSTLIVLVAIPTSLLTTMALMGVLGLNLNLFSMLALTLSVGILVDDSIVILENIARHVGLGQAPIVAALDGRREIGFAAVTITLVDVAVWLPIALLPGTVGEIIRPFALVIACATLTSLAVSFTLTPLLASRFLTLERALRAKRGPWRAFGRQWDRSFLTLARGYRGLLGGVLRGRLLFLPMRWVVIALGLLGFAGGGALLATGSIGLDIFPSGDQSEVDVTLTMPPATALQATNAVVQQIEAKLKGQPDVREVYATVGSAPSGYGGASGGNSAQVTILITPPSQRRESAAQYAQQFQRLLDPRLPNTRLDVSLPNAFGFGGFGGQAIQVAVRGPDPATLNRLVDQVTATMRTVPGVTDVNNDNQNVQPEYVVRVYRQRAADLGVTAQAAGSALQTAIGGTVVAKYRQPGRPDEDIRLVAGGEAFVTPGQLATLPLVASDGAVVQLGQVGTIQRDVAPTQIAHDNRERSVTINASATGATVGTVQTAVQNAVGTIALPSGYSVSYGGQGAQGASAFSDIFKALGLGVVLIYLLMLVLFGSVTLPLAVLMSLPLAIIGALGAMAITGTPFTLFSLLGFAVLLGLVGKNAILLVDYTDTLRKRGLARTDAILDAGPTRLRPIVITTASIMVALVPIALGIEAGSELLKAAAVVLMGGLLSSTLLTLVFVPAMYTVFDDLQALAVRLAHAVARPRPLGAEELAILGGAPAAPAAAVAYASWPSTEGASEPVRPALVGANGHAHLAEVANEG